MTSMHVPDAGHLARRRAQGASAGQANFSKALNRFTKEDPTFRVHHDEESAQTIISGMGELHLEIYIERMKREYNCEVVAGKPQVAYRETITQRGEFNYTHKKQTGGSGQYAQRRAATSSRCRPTRSRPTSSSTTSPAASIPREFIPACDKGFQEAVKKGTLIGFPVVGVRCVINDGASHAVDSSEHGVQDGRAHGLPRGLREGQARSSSSRS